METDNQREIQTERKEKQKEIVRKNINHVEFSWQQTHYFMSKKSWPILPSKLLQKMGQDFLRQAVHLENTCASKGFIYLSNKEKKLQSIFLAIYSTATTITIFSTKENVPFFVVFGAGGARSLSQNILYIQMMDMHS